MASPAEAIPALERDLSLVLKGRTLEEAGWRRPDDLTLLILLQGKLPDGRTDDYFLRLGFGYYPDWPPSAQFVNPDTLTYDSSRDKCWLPRIEGTNEIQVHSQFESNGRILQLICCSVTLEFYLVMHGVEPRHVWDPNSQNFSATINQIKWALKSSYYKGRQDVLPAR